MALEVSCARTDAAMRMGGQDELTILLVDTQTVVSCFLSQREEEDRSEEVDVSTS